MLKLSPDKGFRSNGPFWTESCSAPRKTWGYWQRLERGTSIPLLMEAFGHATQQQTLQYLGIQAEEIAEIFELEL